jgi:hypothetical protein
MTISNYELKILQDFANRQIYDLAQREIELNNILLANDQNLKGIEEKNKFLLKIMERLKEESGIADDIKPLVLFDEGVVKEEA